MCNYTQVPTFSVQPRPKTGPEGSRRCCWPAVCQTFLNKKRKMFRVFFYLFLNVLNVFNETLIYILTDQVDFPIALHMIKGCVDPRGFTMQHCKPAPIGLPGKGNDALCITDKKHYIHASALCSPQMYLLHLLCRQEFQQISL